MTALVIVEIGICVLLAIGIAAAALLTFIKGKEKRPALLVGSSTAAVVLLVGCLVCTGLQINRTRTQAAAAQFEELSQVRVESYGKEEKPSAKQVASAEAETEKETEAETVDRDKAMSDLLAAYFGNSDKTATKSAQAKTASVDPDDVKVYYDLSTSPAYDDTLTYDDTDQDEYSYEYDAPEDYGSYEMDLSEYFGEADYSDPYESYDSGSDEDYDWYSEDTSNDTSYSEETDYTEPETTQPAYVEPETEAYTEPEEPATEETYTWDGSVLTNMSGVNWGPTGKETYYNMDMSGVVSVMRGMGFSEEEYPYYVREDGCKMLGPYIMVAANLNHFPRGSVVECSLGAALVCDTGGFAYSDVGWSQLDIATNW